MLSKKQKKVNICHKLAGKFIHKQFIPCLTLKISESELSDRECASLQVSQLAALTLSKQAVGNSGKQQAQHTHLEMTMTNLMLNNYCWVR